MAVCNSARRLRCRLASESILVRGTGFDRNRFSIATRKNRKSLEGQLPYLHRSFDSRLHGLSQRLGAKLKH